MPPRHGLATLNAGLQQRHDFLSISTIKKTVVVTDMHLLYPPLVLRAVLL
jgi:hypothetical protein